MWSGILVALQIALIFLKKWSAWDDEKKVKAKEIIKESKDAKTASAVTAVFDKLNAL